jgi:hypothetical protein
MCGPKSLKKEVEEGYSTVNRRICDNASVVPAVFSCEENSPLRVSRERLRRAGKKKQKRNFREKRRSRV